MEKGGSSLTGLDGHQIPLIVANLADDRQRYPLGSRSVFHGCIHIDLLGTKAVWSTPLLAFRAFTKGVTAINCVDLLYGTVASTAGRRPNWRAERDRNLALSEQIRSSVSAYSTLGLPCKDHSVLIEERVLFGSFTVHSSTNNLPRYEDTNVHQTHALRLLAEVIIRDPSLLAGCQRHFYRGTTVLEHGLPMCRCREAEPHQCPLGPLQMRNEPPRNRTPFTCPTGHSLAMPEASVCPLVYLG
ncbi:hypothetical protein VNO80_33227 [Phaseolus coccineus]|uniref:Uncharacterized protein n=1 Tax=Phaseolus coccineus TaxID=3886 RepID=A0AAN9L152_PHACN